jgi:hypothetical protein
MTAPAVTGDSTIDAAYPNTAADIPRCMRAVPLGRDQPPSSRRMTSDAMPSEIVMAVAPHRGRGGRDVKVASRIARVAPQLPQVTFRPFTPTPRLLHPGDPAITRPSAGIRERRR